jgi:hypothetical protein
MSFHLAALDASYTDGTMPLNLTAAASVYTLASSGLRHGVDVILAERGSTLCVLLKPPAASPLFSPHSPSSCSTGKLMSSHAYSRVFKSRPASTEKEWAARCLIDARKRNGRCCAC